MKAILDNPYRIVGLLVGATAREQERQINKLKRYLEAGKEPPQDDNSFPVLGKLNRTLNTVEEAASKLHLNSDKMDAAIFWFYDNNTDTDTVDPAIEALKISGALYASTMWSEKTTKAKITEDNCSAFQNFSTLLLCQCLRNKPVNKTFLEQGICMKLQFLDSDFVKELELKATDETYKTTKETVQLSFLNILQREIEQSGEISTTQWIDIISKYEFSAKEEYLNNYIQKLIEQIERKIGVTKDRRGTEIANAANAGNELYCFVKDMLIQLQSILGTSNIKYSSIADKVANEILQCSIDFFNDSQEKELENDYYEKTEALINYAKQIAIGFSAINRIEENTSKLAKMKPEYKLSKAQPYIDKILALLDDPMIINLESKFSRTYSSDEMIAKAKEIITLSQPDLLCIKTILKENNDRYLGISTRVASDAQKLITAGVNQVQEKLDTSSLKEIIKNAWEAIELINTLDLHIGFLLQYQNDIQAVKNRLEKLEIVSKEAEEKLKESNNQYEKNIRDIQNNPYRILGLLAGSTVSEINRHIDLLKAGQKLDVDYSFPCLGRFERTPANIGDAAAKLNLDTDKMNAALFWFWNGDPITDGVAFAALKDGNKILAMNIWTERTYRKEVTESNMSAFQNFSTLLLLMNDYEHGIKLKLNLLESNFITEFITAVTGSTDTVTPEELKSSFLNVLRSRLGLKNDTIADFELSSNQDVLKIKSEKITNKETNRTEEIICSFKNINKQS